MSSKTLFPLIWLGFLATLALAQQPEIEKILEQQHEYSDISDVAEMLDELEKNPLDLNQATVEQLAALPWLSEVLAVAITNLRDQMGRFNSMGELLQIKNINPELLSILRNYVTVSPAITEKKFSFNTKTRISRKLEQCQGLKNGTYYPSANKIYNRLTLNYRSNFRAGLLLEKDSGERIWDDLGLYFISYQNSSHRHQLILGNYRLEFGQGLIFGNPYRYYKGSDPIFAATRRGRELLEYTLVDENASLYGISGKLCFKIYQFTFFISSANLDATLNPDLTVKNLYTSGYHRNAAEIAKKDQLNERLVGARLYFKPASSFAWGVTYYRSLYNHYGVIKNLTQHNDSSNHSKLNDLTGFDYKLTLGKFELFGEAALSKNKQSGLIAGLFMDRRPFELVILGRNYSTDFVSLHGNSFGEQSGYPQNETGIYFGFRFKPLKNWQLNLYFDNYKFPWRTYFVPMPSLGKDLFLSVEHTPVTRLSLLLQLKLSHKDQYNSESNCITPRIQNNVRFQLDYQPWSAIKFRHRIEKVWASYQDYHRIPLCYFESYHGLLLYQDLILKFKNNFNLAARITYFDTEGYESRLYQFEHDVPGVLTNQMLYGLGSRWYIKGQWEFKSVIKIAMKFASVQYHHVNSIGSNEDLISGNTLNTINFQIESHW